MSLTIALKVAQSGLALAEKQLSTTASNITNADTPGYTSKTYEATTYTSGTVTMPSGGKVQGSLDYYIARSVVSTNSANQAASTTSGYLDDYSASYGGTDGTSLSGTLDNLLSALQSDTTTGASQSSIVSAAQGFADQLNSLTESLQSQRTQADGQIGDTVNDANQQLTEIASLNQQIAKASASGGDTADLEDQRMQALQNLSSDMGVQYYIDSNNQMSVYTAGGATLVSQSGAAQLSFTPTANVNSSMGYPGQLSGISVNGQDITANIQSGTLGALLTLRDSTLPQEQSKLDTLADTASTTLNSVLNQGASLPPRTTLTGDTTVAGSDAFSATGSVRIALTDSSGKVASVTDLDLSGLTTVDQVVDAINGIAGLSANVTNGRLTITSTDSSLGVSLNEMDSSVGGSGEGFSQYFGLNDLFAGSGAAGIQVSSYLTANSGALATGQLSNSATLAAGDRGIASGDTSIQTALANALTTSQSFPAAGNLGSKNTTLANYAATLVSGAATMASNADANAQTAETSYNYYSDAYSSATGVNIDEETANMTALQNAYAANAQLIATVREMYQSLLQAMQ